MRLYPVLHVDQRLSRRRRDAFFDRARAVSDRFGGLYVVDRVGLAKNKPSLDVYQDLARETELWLDVGPVHATDLMDCVMCGADRLTVRWDRAWTAESLHEMIGLVDGGIYVGLAFRDGWLAHRRAGPPDVRDLIDRLRVLEDAGLVLIDLDRAGTAQGFRATTVSPAKVDVPVWAAGGVASPREARELFQKGYAGVLVGSARDAFHPADFGGPEGDVFGGESASRSGGQGTGGGGGA